MGRYLISIACFLILCSRAFAQAEISPYLQDKLTQALAANVPVRAQVIMKEQVDIAVLNEQLYAMKASAEHRAYTVITTLQEKANSTQGDLHAYLASKSTDELVQYESYWIANMFIVEAIPSVLMEISRRKDVAYMVFDHVPVPGEIVREGTAPASIPNGSEPGLRAVNAHKMWALGYTGAGQLVMNVDTGVEGTHPALTARWRGNHVPADQAWYGPGTFPIDCDDHGTHTMGTMAGLDPATNDTIGVAPDAEWIAAYTIACGTSSTVGAFQWALDPDGSPFTTEDMPDVISNSWYFQNSTGACFAASWAPILDATEAAGIAVVFSAGNEGPGSQTITAPHNINTNLVNSFAVGSINGNNANFPISGFSSRGPSGCGGSGSLLIKPEAVAPGSSVRSSVRGGGYASFSGTSMACPHVAGAVALLKQVNPNKTGEEIKLALYFTAKETPFDLAAHDSGEPADETAGEDNSYGMGLIDVFAAASLVSPYQVYGMVEDVSTQLPINLASVDVLETGQQMQTDSSGAYNIGPLQDSVQLRFSAFGYYDSTVSMILSVNTPETLNVSLQALPSALLSGTISDSISGQGIVADMLFYGEGDPTGGPTHIATSQPNGTYSISASIGNYTIVLLPSAPYVDSLSRENVILPAGGTAVDFALLEAQILVVDDDDGESYESSYVNSVDRLNYRRRTFSVTDSGTTPTPVLATFAQKPILVWFTGDDSTNALIPDERLVIVNHLAGRGNAIITGQNIAESSPAGDTLLANTLGVQYNGNEQALFVRGFAGDIIGDGVNFPFSGGAGNQNSKDKLTINSGSAGTSTKTLYYSNLFAGDTTAIAGVRVLGPGSTWGATYFSFGLEGLRDEHIDSMIVRSLRYFDQTVVAVSEPSATGVPSEFSLSQNYPNPFNPTTQIQYGLPQEGHVVLTIYNVVGQKVVTLVEGIQPSGFHEVFWNGTNAWGTPVSSGIYFYKLEVQNQSRGYPLGLFTDIKKMIFLK